jgi:ABC-type phosphate transport system ATPase subunit
MGEPVKIEVSGMNFYYGSQKALHDVNMKIRKHFVTALIGPQVAANPHF